MATANDTKATTAPEVATAPLVESKVRLTKKGLPDRRANNRPPAANLSKARAALKEFISKGKQKPNYKRTCALVGETERSDDESETEEDEVKEAKTAPVPIPAPKSSATNAHVPLVRASSRSKVQSPVRTEVSSARGRKSKKTKRIYLSESESESSSDESEDEAPVLYRTKSSRGRKTERIGNETDLKSELERIRKDVADMRIETSQTIQKQSEEMVKRLRKTQDDAFLQAARARISIRYPSQV